MHSRSDGKDCSKDDPSTVLFVLRAEVMGDSQQ